MATFEETILALNPLVFCRLDHFPTDTVMTNIGTDPAQGELYQDGLTTFGVPSPIETDPASMALSGQAGYFVAADLPSSLDLNHTWIAWGYNDGSAPASTLINRNGMWSLSSANVLGFSSANIAGTRFADSLGYSATLTSTAVMGELPIGWYMLTRVRNDTVGQLYVNDILVAQVNDIPTGTLAPYSSNNTLYAFGESNGPTLGFFKSRGIDECILFDYALNGAQIAEVYESALLELQLRGRSDVIVTSTLSSTIEPDPVSFPWRYNWAEPLIERLSFATGISSSATAAEEANSARIAARREFEWVQLLKSNTERRKFRALLWANQANKWLVPVRQDAEQLTAAVAATDTIIPTPTVYKDYEVGGYVGLRQVSDAGVIEHWEEKLITSITPVSVESEPLEHDYAARLSWVYPVKRALLPNAITLRGHTDSVEDVTLTMRLLPEDQAVVPHRITPWSLSIKYRDHEVWDISIWPSNDWSEGRDYDVSRETVEGDNGIGLITVDSDTNASSETIPWRIKTKGRDTVARFLGWFYERRGRWRYLWVPTMQDDFQLLAVDGVNITVADTNYSDSYALAEPRRDLAFVYTDNTMEFRRVVGFSGATNETLELDAPVPSTTNLRFISLLKFCRLDGDQIEIAWHTDDTVEIAWAFREMPHSPEGTGLSSLSPSASVSVSLSPSASASPSSSISPSRSPSASVSPSASQSPSASESSSPSLSPSPSASFSPSASESQSASISPTPSSSLSPSASISQSSSVSPSPSASLSPSASTSPSASPSPST